LQTIFGAGGPIERPFTATDKGRRAHAAYRLLSAGALAVLAMAVVAVGFSVWHDRQGAIADGVKDSRNIAISMAGEIEQLTQAIDSRLRGVQRRVIEADPYTLDSLTSPRFHGFLSVRLRSLPQLIHIGVADARGNLLVSTAAWPAPKLNVSDRDYFQELRANDDDRLAISLPHASRAIGQPVIVFARRLNGPDRTFLGAAFVAVTVDYVQGLYRKVEPLSHQAFSLMRRDGAVLLREPAAPNPPGGRIPPDKPFHAAVAAGGGVVRGTGLFGTRDRWVAVQPLSHHPLVAVVSVPEDVLLADWRDKAALISAGTLALLGCALALLAIMARQFRKISASEAMLADKTQALEREHAQFNAALENMSQGLAMFDADNRLVVCNERYREINRMSVEQSPIGSTLRDILVHRHLRRGTSADVDSELGEIRASMSQGRLRQREVQDIDGRVIAIRNKPMPGGGWVATFDDVTDQRAGEAKIRQLAHHDLITGVANRARFLERIAEARELLSRDGRPFNVMMLDLDHFKTINDSLGHPAGDALLKETARRLSVSMRAKDVLARLGGDEFAIIQTEPRNHDAAGDEAMTMRDAAVALANRIIETVSEPYDLNGEHMVVSCSVGIAMAPQHGKEPEELMKRADLALYRAKSDGRNGYAFFEAEMAQAASERQRLEADMRRGLAREEFALHYQPLVDAATRRLCGLEALVRWQHPDQGLIAPDRFISLAEDTGLITALGEWVLETGCRDAARWPPHVKIAINISPVQFRKTNLFDTIVCALVDSGLPAERLEVEITERVLLANDGEYLSVLHKLKNLGVGIALDDFGTGYSSLSYLTMFPFDKIKIDQSFTRQSLERPDCAAIIAAVIGLGRSLGITTLAEGVETERQFAALRAAGVSQVQGYLLGRAVPADQIAFAAGGHSPGADPELLRDRVG